MNDFIKSDRGPPDSIKQPATPEGDDDGPHVTDQVLAEHFGVCDMTIKRWKRNPALKAPQGFMLNGRNYNSLPAWKGWARELARLRAAGASPKGAQHADPQRI